MILMTLIMMWIYTRVASLDDLEEVF
jgi:hypothetical protein